MCTCAEGVIGELIGACVRMCVSAFCHCLFKMLDFISYHTFSLVFSFHR